MPRPCPRRHARGTRSPAVIRWRQGVLTIAQAMPVVACCIIAFYYNDLYDLRLVDTLGEFASRLWQAFGVALLLLAVSYALFPETRIPAGPFAVALVGVTAIL